MVKCVSYQGYPPCGLHDLSLYVHCFCNSECINTFLLYYVSWSMYIAKELFNLNGGIHILHAFLHTFLVLLMRRICLTIKIFFTG